MSKKLNGSGGLQEYIPAGNGEASGQYGNDAGNNKNFKQGIKNPKAKSAADGGGASDKVEAATSGSSDSGSNARTVEATPTTKPKKDYTTTFSDKTQIKTATATEAGEKEVRDIYQRIMDTPDVSEESNEYISAVATTIKAKIGVVRSGAHFSPTDNVVNLSPAIISDRNAYDVMVHEYSHAADYNYVIPKDKLSTNKFEWNDKKYGVGSSKPKLSTNYICSDGKTMSENLFTEITRATIDKIKEDCKAEYEKFAAENKSALDIYNYVLSREEIDKYDDYFDFMRKNPDMQKLDKEYYENRTIFQEGWSAISDLVSGFDSGSGLEKIGFCHGPSYYPRLGGKAGGIGKDHLSQEVFAEMSTTMTGQVHSKKKAELFSKYCPKTYTNYKEIQSDIIANKLRAKKEDQGVVSWSIYND